MVDLMLNGKNGTDIMSDLLKKKEKKKEPVLNQESLLE